MITFYLVRHGETLFNVQKKMQGWCDSPLTKRGIKQALALQEGLKNIPFVQAYSSTSERTIDTANIILKNRDVPFQSSKKLKELNFGTLEGIEESRVLWDEDNRYEGGFVDVGGEDMNMVRTRVLDFLKCVAQETTDQQGNILVVTHGAVIMSLMKYYCPQQLENLKAKGGLQNCSVSMLYYDDSFSLGKCNLTNYSKDVAF